MKHFRTILCVLVAVMLVSATMVTAQQKAPAKKLLMQKRMVKMPIITVKLKGKAYKYMGLCPVTAKFTGTVTSTAAVKLNYHFVRSDGATMRPRLLEFKPRDLKPKTIPYTWSFGKDGQGWVQLVVKLGSKEIKSLRVEFIVDCDERKAIKPVLKKFDWKMIKKPLKVKAPKLTLQKGYVAKLIPTNVDLRVNRVVASPRRIRRYSGRVYIYVHVANAGEKPSPACKIAIRLKAQRKHPKHGDFFEFKYDIPALSPGAGGWARYPFHNFWHGKWNVMVKIDANNSVAEVGKEGNNVYPRGGAPQVYFRVF